MKLSWSDLQDSLADLEGTIVDLQNILSLQITHAIEYRLTQLNHMSYTFLINNNSLKDFLSLSKRMTM